MPPTYSYECPGCGDVKDEYRSVAKRNDCPMCKTCDREMRKIITPGFVRPDIAPYYDDNLQTYVESRQHKKQVMREQEVTDKREFKGHRWKH